MSQRAAARAGCKTILDSYKTTYTDSTQPEYLAEVLETRPERVSGRMAWVNKGVTEQLTFGASVRSRVLQPSITVTNKLASNIQAADEQDAIVDALIDKATELSRTAVSNAVLLPATVEDEEITSDDGIYTGFTLTFALFTQQGRTI